MFLNLIESGNLINRFFGDMDRVSEGVTSNLYPNEFTRNYHSPAVNVYYNETEAKITALLPGYDPEQINLEVKENKVVLSSTESSKNEQSKTNQREEILLKEFKRVIELPFLINLEAVKAVLKNGVLNLTLPKAESEKPKKIQILSSESN
jgi:HSP20 family protein